VLPTNGEGWLQIVLDNQPWKKYITGRPDHQKETKFDYKDEDNSIRLQWVAFIYPSNKIEMDTR
jgi:hypothetical protein